MSRLSATPFSRAGSSYTGARGEAPHVSRRRKRKDQDTVPLIDDAEGGVGTEGLSIDRRGSGRFALRALRATVDIIDACRPCQRDPLGGREWVRAELGREAVDAQGIVRWIGALTAIGDR